MLRFPVARFCPEPVFVPLTRPDEAPLIDAELRTDALLRDAALHVRPARLLVDEVVANFGPGGIPLVDVSLAVRGLESDDPCLSLCRLLSQLLTRLNEHLEGTGR